MRRRNGTAQVLQHCTKKLEKRNEAAVTLVS